MSNERFFLVSFAQQRLLFLDQLDPGASAYNLTRAIRMVGPLDPGALSKTLNKIVQRHASLRTKFVLEAEKAYQIVSDGVELQLPIIDISHLPDAVREPEAQRLAREEGHKIFNLTSGPLFRAILVRLGPAVHVLVLVMHHIITDGWSMSILFDEIGQIYAELAHAKPRKIAAACHSIFGLRSMAARTLHGEDTPPSCDVLDSQAARPPRLPRVANRSTASDRSKPRGSDRNI